MKIIPGGNGFAGNEYLDVADETHRDQLMGAKFANVKIVRDLYPITRNGIEVPVAAWGGPGPSYLVKGSHVSNGQLFAHEFGHSQGLPHREDIGPVPGSNPGADEKAIMHWQLLPVGKEINRNERGAFASPIAEGWNSR